mmetsp:Transcript_38675/g.64151  ORF Transcript_38675/g.64151 Transcript_38675/m.64151 type:complete len:244 (-) Transcript_38675:1905-2636(-)
MLQPILKLRDGRNCFLQPLALACCQDDLHDLRVCKWIARHGIPVVKEHLRESLTRCLLAQESIETERFGDWKVSFDLVHGCTRPIGLFDNGATLAIDGGVNAAHCTLRTLNLDHENRLLQAGVGRHHGCQENAAGRRDDLSATTVDCIGVQYHVIDLNLDIATDLVAQRALFADPLPSSDDRILDLVQILHANGSVHDQVWARTIGTEAPYLLRLGLVPAELVNQNASAGFRILVCLDLAILN